MKLIDNYQAIRLFLNIYTIEKTKKPQNPVDQEKFLEIVQNAFSAKNYNYEPLEILLTWKKLLEQYRDYKQNLSPELAKEWQYFQLVDNCFDEVKSTAHKFNKPNLVFFLIDRMSYHRNRFFKEGLSMDLLLIIENEFLDLGHNEINQKDIYVQWNYLTRSYSQYRKQTKTLAKNKKFQIYFDAMQKFFENADPISLKRKQIDGIPNKRTLVQTSSNDTTILEQSSFTLAMHNILLNCFKNKKDKLHLVGEPDEEILKYTLKEFENFGYNVTIESIHNEWNDLTSRYTIIKNSEDPTVWPFFNDIDRILNPGTVQESSLNDKETLTQGRIRKLDKLLNAYDAGCKELCELKETLLEKNLLKEETNYLLKLFSEKYSKCKRLQQKQNSGGRELTYL